MTHSTTESETNRLLNLAAAGDAAAKQTLLDRNRGKLKEMVQLRIDRRIAARIDPSDVVQEALLAAVRRFDDYLRDRPIAFYPWLRRIALERLLDLRRRHIVASRRSVDREVDEIVSDNSRRQLVERFAKSETGPLQKLAKRELNERVSSALASLSESDREVLVLRMLEQISVKETSQVLQTTEDAVKQRQVRALRRIRKLLDGESGNQT